jgi:glycosyltransferase involved in cell wall biosynthesis
MNNSSLKPLKVLIVGAGLDGTDVGEVYSAFQWVKALSQKAEVTLLTSERVGRKRISEQLPLVKVVSWDEPAFLVRHAERLNALLKPALPLFFYRVERWLRDYLKTGQTFDIAHQIVPQAMRYGSPLRKFDIPYVIGPLGGGLTTPEGFRTEVSGQSMITRLRVFDGVRLKHDPVLRASYSRAGLILGVAPYVTEALKSIPLRRLEIVPERANDSSPVPPVQRQAKNGELKLLHVGRAVRTKGLRDAIRAMQHLQDLPRVTLESAGDGEDLAACRAEAETLGVSGRVHFYGKIPRSRVDELYQSSDVFTFPSFREPMGGVLFEAMSWGLPIIGAARGGPEFIISDESGIRIPVTTPGQYARDIANAIRSLAMDPQRRLALGKGALARLASFGTWDDRARELIGLYSETIADHELRSAAS